MSGLTITKADLDRLAREIADGDKFAWIAERGIEPAAILSMTEEIARRLGRRSIGIELKADHAQQAAERLAQLSLFGEQAA